MPFIDIITILLVFLGLGYIGYKSTKAVENTDDFMLANRSLGRIRAGFSMAATDMGGSVLIGGTAYVYGVGVAGIWWNWCAVIPLLIVGFFLAKKLRGLMLTTGTEFLEKRFNKQSRLIASVMQICSIVAGLSAQFMVSAITLNVITGIPINTAFIISLIIVVVYTAGGGLIAVVNTDVYQYSILLTSITITVAILLFRVGGVGNIMRQLPKSYSDIRAIGFWKPFSWHLLWFFSYVTSQNYQQKLFASKDNETARFAFNFTGVMYIVVGIGVTILGLGIAVIFPELENPNSGYALLISKILPVGISGIALGGVFAAAMSTADSMILSATSLFVEDIYKPYINKKSTDRHILKTSRIITVVLSVFACIVAKLSGNIIEIMYVGGLFYATSAFAPFIMGIFWKRANSKGALSAIIASTTVGLLLEFVFKGKVSGFLALPSNLIAALTGFIVIIIVSLMTEKPSPEKMLFGSDK